MLPDWKEQSQGPPLTGSEALGRPFQTQRGQTPLESDVTEFYSHMK